MNLRMRFVLAMALLLAVWAVVAAAGQKQPVSPAVDKQALAAPEVKQLLQLMDTDQNGKISKEEWMKFMSAEFDRLDKDKSGQLDVKELTQSRVRASHFADMGK